VVVATLPAPAPPVPVQAAPVPVVPVPNAPVQAAPGPAAPVQAAPVQPASAGPAEGGSGSAAAFAVAARRDISLLNRQLQTLDELERTEADPDTLQQLFLLDNLTMRLRRGAESLLVLAGSPPGRRVREATPASDVVRTASAQIEFYERVRVDLTDDPPLAAVHVVPVAHLLAEILENATAFSPPDAVVDVTGGCDDEALHVVVRDSGLGMTPDELARAESDLGARDRVVSRTERLGLAVVGRIADRLGITVAMSARSDGPGTVVSVRLPRELFDVADPDDGGADEATRLDEPVLPAPAEVPDAAPILAAAAALPSRGAPGGPSLGEPYVPVMAHGAHAAEPLAGGPRRTSRSRAHGAATTTAAEGIAPVEPPGSRGYSDPPSFDSILTGGTAVGPDGPTRRHGRAGLTQGMTAPPPGPAHAPAVPPPPGTFYPDAALPVADGMPAASVPDAPGGPGWDGGASSWAPDGAGAAGGALPTTDGWSAAQSSLAASVSLQQEALSALSSMSSYRPEVSERSGSAVLTHRRPTAVEAPLDPAEEAVVRDAEALRARLSSFRAATRLGRETGATRTDHDPRTDPTTLAEELP
jgi:hypothetical protein